MKDKSRERKEERWRRDEGSGRGRIITLLLISITIVHEHPWFLWIVQLYSIYSFWKLLLVLTINFIFPWFKESYTSIYSFQGLTIEVLLEPWWCTTSLGGPPIIILVHGWQMPATSPTRTLSYSSLVIKLI